MRSRGTTLAGQYLVLQLAIVVAVLIGVVALSLAQAAESFERVEGRRALSAAESLAANPAVRSLLPTAEPRLGAALPAVAESVRSVSGFSYVALAKWDGTILTSPDPSQIGEKLPLGESQVQAGRSWTGPLDMGGQPYLAAHVPVFNDSGAMVGIAAAARAYPSVPERLVEAAPNLLTYLGISLALGTAGSLLLARRVKRQTLGMEPDEIAGLVKHREAIVQGVKEGVLALDPGQRVTLANETARRLLSLPPDCVGRQLRDLPLAAELQEVLTSEQEQPDRLVLVAERVVALNRMPLRSHGRLIGSVTTLRDRTELSTLERELGMTRAATDMLRAQTHEFANQLHTISGLIQIGEHEEVVKFVDGVHLSRTRLHDEVTSRIEDPAVAALLIAKASIAAERGLRLHLDGTSLLGRLPEDLSRDLTTVVGNLVDNAMDAVIGTPSPGVDVTIRDTPRAIEVRVKDNGPGVPPENIGDIFRQGYTTKQPGMDGDRGFGLALTRLVCIRRGGDIGIRNDGGAVFEAFLAKDGADT
ncbi:ATP-binding protein [Arthrobacter ginkgonis]|uniref:histidine kinase n=2 Tax=Arthrobacter ginkgonis TaxID=1630594 RepID=A0ABP7BXB1_9MICC